MFEKTDSIIAMIGTSYKKDHFWCPSLRTRKCGERIPSARKRRRTCAAEATEAKDRKSFANQTKRLRADKKAGEPFGRLQAARRVKVMDGLNQSLLHTTIKRLRAGSPKPYLINGGADGTRTRDLRRDRPAF
jgi:hypothetical protein